MEEDIAPSYAEKDKLVVRKFLTFEISKSNSSLFKVPLLQVVILGLASFCHFHVALSSCDFLLQCDIDGS